MAADMSEAPTGVRTTPYDHARALADAISGVVIVDGARHHPAGTTTFAVENPADATTIGHAPRCGTAEVDWAVGAAAAAQPAWGRLAARERGDRLRRVADCIERDGEALARLLALETGNALTTQARPEVAASVELLRLFAGLASELKGRTLPWDAGTLCYTTRDPLGVVAAIIPWNAPLLLTAAKVAPAIIAGNTVVLKPAEQAPLAAMRYVELMQGCLPAGVVNAISGYGEEVGRPLAEHPLVRKVTFTGSGAVGRQIMHYAANKLCPVTLELGGKSPNIVLPDADLDIAVPGILTGMRFTRQGQSCSAGTRVLLHADIHDEVVERVLAAMGRLRLGDPLDDSTEVGAIISAEQLQTVERYVALARATPGARILCGGERPARPGYYYAPTLIDGLPATSPVCQDEIFGPVAVVDRWTDFDTVIDQANASPFGLAATIWTRDLSRAFAFADRIQAGFVQVNQYITPRASLSYGGLKMSGLGRENTLESMLEHFTSSKTVIINHAAGQRPPPWHEEQRQ